jgi:hypothetical protein
MQPRTDAWYIELDAITRDLTGYDSFEKLCLAHPTLRILPNVSADYRIKMLRLRRRISRRQDGMLIRRSPTTIGIRWSRKTGRRISAIRSAKP